MALKQANTLAPSNVSATGFALADARHIGGHRVVASLTDLYALLDWQLLNPDDKDPSMALGQQWYVKGDGFYRLTNWNSRKAAGGWTKVIDPNNIDTTLFQIVSALPTSGINKNRIYIKTSENKDTQGKNMYAEYIYTGNTSAAYDESKWEKLGEYTPSIDMSPYLQHIANKKNPHEVTKEQVGLGKVTNDAQIPLAKMGTADGVATLDANGKVTDAQLWDATNEKHGLMTPGEKKAVANYVGNRDSGVFGNVCIFTQILAELVSNATKVDGKAPGNPTESGMEIFYVRSENKFYAYNDDSNIYYTDWEGKAETFGKNNTPDPNKLYLQTRARFGGTAARREPTVYTTNGTDLFELAKESSINIMSNEEIDALFE